jgi:hypothetical protein
MSSSFAEVVEEVKALSIQEKQELHQLIEKYLIEARRQEIFEGYVRSQTEFDEGKLEFSSHTNDLRGMLIDD